jgi:ornithine cyclodeaminase
LLIVGAGEEAYHHVLAVMRVREFEYLTVWARSPDRAHQLLRHAQVPRGVSATVDTNLERATREADVICTVTSAKEPILRGEWLAAGTHLNLVGSAIATTAEVDVEAVRRGVFYVDYLEAARAQAGELLAAIRAGVITENHVAGEIGEVLLGTRAGRANDADITIYKSLGITTQDLAAAECAWREATRRGVGRAIDLGA